MVLDTTNQTNQEQLLHILLENVRDHAVFEVDESGVILQWNKSVGRVFGFTEEELMHQNMAMLYPSENRNPEKVFELITRTLHIGRSELDSLYARQNGIRFRAHTIMIPIQDAQSHARIIVVVRDLSVLMATQDQLHGLATLDQMTGLANRQHLFDLGRVEYRRWRRYRVPLSMIICDIDRLRDVNGKYGENVGDAVLRDMSDVLRQCVREVDMVGRLDGGTFCALLFSTPLEGAGVLGERIRRAVNATIFQPEGANIRLSVTLAATTAGESASDFDEFFKQTEAHLRNTKKLGGDRLIVG